MKPIILILAATALLFTSCDQDKKAIRQMCEEIHAQYPSATLQDVYKTCYQDFFGAEHLVSDTASARQYLESELEQCRGTDLNGMPKREPTGFRHRFTRINLSCVIEGELTEAQLLAMFLEASKKDNAFSGDWEKEWHTIENVALKVCPAWADPALENELQQAAHNKEAVRHSDAFRSAYNPHYRIVRSK